MGTDLTTRPIPSIVELAADADAPRLVTRDGEVVPLADASVDTMAAFLDTMRAMRDAIEAAEAAVRGEVAQRADQAGTRTLRVGGAKVTLDAPTTAVFALDAALADLRALLDERGEPVHELDAAVEAIRRTKVTHEPDHAAVKRLRAMGDRDVNAILDRHTHSRPRDRRTVRVEWDGQA